jgi:hypothetical protein
MILMDQVKYHSQRHLAAPAAFHGLGCSDAPILPTDHRSQRGDKIIFEDFCARFGIVVADASCIRIAVSAARTVALTIVIATALSAVAL